MMDKEVLFNRFGQHRRFCYQEPLSISVHEYFLPSYDKLNDDIKERVMATVSVLMTVKQPNWVGYVGEEDKYAIDVVGETSPNKP